MRSSNKHVQYAYDSKEFWDWDVNDLGTDIAGMVQKINSNTGKKVSVMSIASGASPALALLTRDNAYYSQYISKVGTVGTILYYDPAVTSYYDADMHKAF